MNPHKVVAVIILATLGLSAANAAWVQGEIRTVTLWAGQFTDAGEVKFEVIGDDIKVTFKTDPPWVLTQTHLYLGTSAPGSAPGSYPYKNDTLPDVTEYIYIIPIANISVQCDGTVYFAAHAVVKNGSRTETGWGFDDCTEFGQGWGRYCTFKLACQENGLEPAIDIEKLVNGFDADDPTGPTVTPGSTVTFTYVIANVGDVTLTNVVITDDKLGTIANVGTLLPGEDYSTEKQDTAKEGQNTNIGSVSGMAPDGSPVTDDDPANYFGEGDKPPEIPAIPLVAIPFALGAVLLIRRRK